MFFGLPWFAIVAIVAIAGGLIYAYKEEELKMEGKRLASSREIHDLRQIVHNLKSRVETLEAIATEEKRSPSRKQANPLGDIEIDDEVNEQNSDNSGGRTRNRN
ncbi:MAG TPA: hypothetical protein VFM80_06795 [Gracilimonas sp.]|uniref:hypothetical protein n=1 Tax=Gracilimonas sp. TaxID=1974203 RepID=UPI002D915879|nr:hypothetical protein [Gracilimonas sp.]